MKTKNIAPVYRIVEIDQELRAIDDLRRDRKQMKKRTAAFKKELRATRVELWTERESIVSTYARNK